MVFMPVCVRLHWCVCMCTGTTVEHEVLQQGLELPALLIYSCHQPELSVVEGADHI